ncbi:MAG: (d)CMP kinase [Chitinophagales bacterium]
MSGGRVNIAIDGPAGAGKSTVAKLVARELGLLYVDTGAMYRAITVKALRCGCDLADEEALTRLAACSEVRLVPPAGEGDPTVVMLDGEDVTAAVRSPEVNRAVSLVARIPGVRTELVRMQRDMAREGGVVMDGRDIGTVVLPDADFKFFLTASLEERARRRVHDLTAQGFHQPLAEVSAEVARRDRLDSEREVSPLRRAPDAVLVDSTALDVAEVVAAILAVVRGNR